MKTVGEKISEARQKRGLSPAQLARLIGVSRPTVDNWEDDTHPVKDKWVPALIKVLGMKEADFNRYGPGLSRPASTEEKSIIPLLQWSDLRRVVGGKLTMLAAAKQKYIQGAADLPGECFALKVDDSAMEPLFQRGEVIVVDPSARPEDGEFVVARLGKAHEHVLRRYVARRDSFDLQAENIEYSTITANSATPAEIVGVVIEHRRRLRR